MKRSTCASLILGAAVLCGCESYEAMPLDSAAAEKAITPPSRATLDVEARELSHPILPPLKVDFSDGLSPDEAAVVAVLANPSLRAERDRRKLAEAQLLETGLLPNPEFSYGLLSPPGVSSEGTMSAFGAGLNFDYTKLIGRSSRETASEQSRQQVNLQVAWQEWIISEAAKSSAYRTLNLEKRVSMASTEEAQLASRAGVIRKMTTSGRATELDVSAVQAAWEQARGTTQDLRSQVEQERLRLARLLGYPVGTPITLQSNIDLPLRVDLPSADELLTGMEDRRLDLVALRRGYESQESTLSAAVLDQFPRASAGILEARDTGGVPTSGVGVAVDIPAFNRNQGNIALQRAARQVLFDEYAGRLLDARSEVAALFATIRSLNEKIRIAREAVPGLARMTDAYRRALETHSADALSYYTARRALRTKQMEIVALQQDLEDSVIRLEVATGLFRVCQIVSDPEAHPVIRRSHVP